MELKLCFQKSIDILFDYVDIASRISQVQPLCVNDP